MRQLARPVALHDIRDLEAHIRAAIRSIPGVTASLPPANLEDLVADLIGTTWEASLRYNPDNGYAFSNLAYRLVRCRTIDHIRQRNGYTRNGTKGQRTSIPLDTADTTRNQLGSAITQTSRDLAESRAPDLQRALADRRGRNTRLLRPHRQSAPRRAA